MAVKLKKLYEGKAKIIYAKTSKEVIAAYKNDATAFNNLKKGSIKNKGAINNAISSYLFQILNHCDIPTHFIKKIDKKSQLLKKVDIIPIEVLVRNFFAGSLSKKLIGGGNVTLSADGNAITINSVGGLQTLNVETDNGTQAVTDGDTLLQKLVYPSA